MKAGEHEFGGSGCHAMLAVAAGIGSFLPEESLLHQEATAVSMVKTQPTVLAVNCVCEIMFGERLDLPPFALQHLLEVFIPMKFVPSDKLGFTTSCCGTRALKDLRPQLTAAVVTTCSTLHCQRVSNSTDVLCVWDLTFGVCWIVIPQQKLGPESVSGSVVPKKSPG